MPTTIVLGAQWGDEGKGKIIDVLSSRADVVVRFSGGANAGHTLVVGGVKQVAHLIPSGVLHPHVMCVLGQGMVIDPQQLVDEIQELAKADILLTRRLLISDEAFIVLPLHKTLDGLREGGSVKIGTTRRGIGPAYEDKISRRGLQIRDLLHPEGLRAKLQNIVDFWQPQLERSASPAPQLEATVKELLALGKSLCPYVTSTRSFLHRALREQKKLLLEGAQGTLLDVDHGTYPYVTSASVAAGGALTGTGLGPRHIGRVIGVTKAYCTRVGEGPFPTELEGSAADGLREAGEEFGATTGRARRCGWLDLPLLRFASRINSFDGLALTKLDVLNRHAKIQLCTAYRIDGKIFECPDSLRDLSHAEPIYEEYEGWQQSLEDCKALEQLPAALKRYLERIEEAAECPVDLVSIGAERNQTIIAREPFN